MDMPVNKFKRAINEGRIQLGAWLVSGAPSTAEALGCAGFDFLVVDMEHTPVDTPEMIEILRTIAGTPAQAMVRLVWNDPVWLKRVLDGGAQTVLLPLCPDRGGSPARRRGNALSTRRHSRVAGNHRGSRFRHRRRLPEERRQRTVRDGADRNGEGIRQSRRHRRGTRRGLDLHRAFRPRGIDADFWATSATRRYRKNSRRRRDSCAELRKPCGVLGMNPEMTAQFIGYGYDWVAIGSDMAFMVGRAQEVLGKARAVPPAASAGRGGD